MADDRWTAVSCMENFPRVGGVMAGAVRMSRIKQEATNTCADLFIIGCNVFGDDRSTRT